MSSLRDEFILPESVLKNLRNAPRPYSVELIGKKVKLVPFDMNRDLEVLYRITNGSAIHIGDQKYEAYDSNELIWKYFAFGPFPSINEFRAYLSELANSDLAQPLVVFDKKTSHQIGFVCMIGTNPQYLKFELGHIWYSPIAQKTGANLEACYLLINHAFESGYRRVEWKCHSLNRRSFLAAQRIGFVYEFTQKNHMVSKGSIRDTCWFRILDCEWSEVKVKLIERLNEGVKINLD